jgi:5-methylcytosine-specific restriction endonuclease McrA
MNYKEQLLDPRWQRRRLEILQRDEFTCQKCLSKDKTLHVHHIDYIKGRMA